MSASSILSQSMSVIFFAPVAQLWGQIMLIHVEVQKEDEIITFKF